MLILQFAEIYHTQINKRVYTVKFGSHTIVTNLDSVAKTGAAKAYDIFTEFTLTANKIYVNGVLITGAISSSRLVIDFYKNIENPKISGLILIRGNCAIADNCNQCYDMRCATCNYLTSICTSCILGSTVVNKLCACNANTFWVNASRSCIVCDNLCGGCVSQGAFLCTTCPGTYALISNVCLRACPYGFSSPCSSISTQVLNVNFNNLFLGTYEIFRTGTNAATYYFFNSPETTSDPVPAKSRGLYFSGGRYLETSTTVYISLNFSLGIWVRVLAGSKDILSRNPNNSLSISNTGVMSLRLETHLEVAITLTTAALNPSNTAWAYISYIVSFNTVSLITTITPSLNASPLASTTSSGYIFRDILSNTIILGKKGVDSYIGFIYQFDL